MNHEKYKQWMVLEYYNELTEKDQTELLAHLDNCDSCRTEYEILNNELRNISNKLHFKNEEHLLEEARHSLRNNLIKDNYKEKSWDMNILSIFAKPKLRLAVGGLALFILGFFISTLIFDNSNNTPFQTNNNPQNLYLNEHGMRLNNINFTYTDPNTGDLQVNFEAVKPVTVKGNIKDKNIQNILMYSMLEEKNPGTRLNTISFINNKMGTQLDEEVKQTIITVVKYDKNPGVRMEGLKLLNSLGFDEQVKQTLLYVIMNDKNSAMRINAINKLAEETSKRNILQSPDLNKLKKKLNTDNNNYVKLTVQKVLEEK